MLRGLNVEESSGSSQHKSDEGLNEVKNTQPASENSNLCTYQSPHLDNSSTFEIISVDAPPSKTDLQIELLRQQIEFTKREIYERELSILEKERTLLITTEERDRLLFNSESAFTDRRTI